MSKSSALISIEITAGDEERGEEHKMGRLNPSLYGTRGVAIRWQDESIGALERNATTEGKASPFYFHHDARTVSITVHGDDFISIGNKRPLKWFESIFD